MVGLKRNLSLLDLVLYGVGIIVGAGIYALIGPAVALGGNATWMAFLIGAFIAALTGFSFAELGSLYPKSAAEYVYVKKAYGNELFAFLVGWITIFVSIFTLSAVSIAFGNYLGSLLPFFSANIWAVLMILFITAVALAGIGESAKLNAVLTLVTVGGLIFLFVIGMPSLGSVDYFEMPHGVGGLIGAAALIFFAYLGFDDIANVAEEAKNARKMMPKAIIISVIVTSLIYVAIAISTVSLAGWEEIGASKAPLALAASKAFPEAGTLLAIVALFATGSTILISAIAGSRMIYGMAKNKSLPKILGAVNRARRTPHVAILIVSAVSLFWAFSESLEYVASVTNVGAFLTFAFVNLALLGHRYFKPKVRGYFRAPLNIGWFPVPAFIGLLSCGYMLSTFALDTWLLQVAILAVGLIVYFYMHRR